MIRLITLGNTDLRADDGRAADAVVRQPRRFALLVYLALESRRGFVRRDRVLATFWPEVTTEQGRRSLSQALHYLRQALGSDALLSRGHEEIRLDPRRVPCDACAFLDAAEGDDPDAALRSFTGEFLPGFFCSGVTEFEAWLEQTRTALRRTASDCAWAAAERACDAHEWVTAAAHARRAAELAGDDEPATRRLMAFLAGLGDRAGALEAYDLLAQRLEQEYATQPAEPTRRLAAEIRELPQGLAPELAPPIVRLEPETAATVGTPAPPRPGFGARARSVAVTAVLLVAFASLWGLGNARRQPEPDLSRARLLVEEVRGSAPGEALTAELIRHLSGSRQVEVLAQEGEPRRAAGLDLVLRTTFTATEDSLRATAALVDRQTGATVAVNDFGTVASTAPQITGLAAQISTFARQRAGDELDRRRALRDGIDPGLVEELWAARGKLYVADSLRSGGFRELAQGRMMAADSQLARIEAMEPRWIVPPLARAEAAYERLWFHLFPPQDFTATRAAVTQGMAHANRAIGLDASDARGYEVRGVLGYFLWATTPADSTEHGRAALARARTDLEHATRLSRDAARAWRYLSQILFEAGDFTEAYAAGRAALEADGFMRTTIGNHVRLFWSALEVGDFDGAQRWCRGIDELVPESWEGERCTLALTGWAPHRFPLSAAQVDALEASALEDPAVAVHQLRALKAVVLAHAGREREVSELLQRLEARLEEDPNLLPDVAWIYSALGDHERARELLARYVDGNPQTRQFIVRSGRFTASFDAAPPAGGRLASSSR